MLLGVNWRTLPMKKNFGICFLGLFVIVCILQLSGVIKEADKLLQILSGVALIGVFVCFFGGKRKEIENKKEKISKRTLVSLISVLIFIPLTIFAGVFIFDDRRYYFISILIILEILIPYFISFSNKKTQARELVVISVLCALAVCSRIVLSMLPQFKPVLAIIIIGGICFGGETGFLVGAITGFVSNFYFGHGAWTPWQMLAMGMVGFVAGIVFKKGFFKKNRVVLSIYGFLSTIIIYGGILNPASVLMMQQTPTLDAIIASCALGFPYDAILGASTAFFLWFLSEDMLFRIERIKTKYGLM